MASKADSWRRLHQLLRSPSTAYTQVTGEGEDYARTWTTDRYVLVNHLAAGLPHVEPGAWTMRATQPPAPEQAGGVAPNPEWFRQRLEQLGGCQYDREVTVTPWSHDDGRFTCRLLTAADGTPAWLLDGVARGWAALAGPRDPLTLALSADGKVIRAVTGERLAGYLMTVREDGFPALPQLAASRAA